MSEGKAEKGSPMGPPGEKVTFGPRNKLWARDIRNSGFVYKKSVLGFFLRFDRYTFNGKACTGSIYDVMACLVKGGEFKVDTLVIDNYQDSLKEEALKDWDKRLYGELPDGRSLR